MNRKPSLIIVAGPNGAGKTTITEKLLKHTWMQGCLYINPDNIAKERFGDWNNPKHVVKAANMAKKMREEALKNHRDLAFESVFSTDEKVDFVLKAQKLGYFIRLFFVCTNSPSVNAQRVTIRMMKGGHAVPIDKIISRFYRSISNCIRVLPMVDRLYLYDNSLEQQDPLLLMRMSNGEIVKTYEDLSSFDWTNNFLSK